MCAALRTRNSSVSTGTAPAVCSPKQKETTLKTIFVTVPLCSPETSPGMADMPKITPIHRIHNAHESTFFIKTPLSKIMIFK